jgi:predicted ATPase
LSTPIALFAPTDQLLSEPTVIVLEDLQWADRRTLDLFRYLARELDGAQLLLVGTHRDAEVNRCHELSSLAGELSRRPGFVRISLRGLSSSEVLRFATAYTAHKVSEAAAEALHVQTDGNPLFIKEITRFLIDHDLELNGPDVVAGVLPTGLQDAIRRSMAGISGDCKEFLSIASVIGREFETEIVAEVAGLDDQQVRMALEEAQRARVVEDIGGLRGVRFRFVHVLFRLTLYEELFVPRRLEIHQRAAHARQRREVKARAERAAELSQQFAKTSSAAGLDVLSLSARVRRYG